MADSVLKLKDGTIYTDGDCGYADGRLWCWLKQTNFAQAFADFSNPAKTGEIHLFHGTHETIYSGFTELDVIKRSEYEPGHYSIDIRLAGESTGIEERVISEVTDAN